MVNIEKNQRFFYRDEGRQLESWTLKKYVTSRDTSAIMSNDHKSFLFTLKHYLHDDDMKPCVA